LGNLAANAAAVATLSELVLIVQVFPEKESTDPNDSLGSKKLPRCSMALIYFCPHDFTTTPVQTVAFIGPTRTYSA
jgi:hypothetical protein